MNIPGPGFARISGRLRPSRKKILWKNGVFKRVINDISGFSHEGAFYIRAFTSNEIFRGAWEFWNRTIYAGRFYNIKALTRPCSEALVFS